MSKLVAPSGRVHQQEFEFPHGNDEVAAAVAKRQAEFAKFFSKSSAQTNFVFLGDWQDDRPNFVFLGNWHDERPTIQVERSGPSFGALSSAIKRTGKVVARA